MARPNLIYVFADQLRYASVGYNGDQRAITPNIDNLAAHSLNLCNAVSGHPVCAPYRASLFTGKYTTSTGMVINEIRINPNHRAIGHVLTEGGYDTAYIGKWHIYANKFNDHYNVESSYIPKGADRLGFDDYFAAYNFHHEYYAPKAYYHLDGPEKIYTEGYEPDAQVDLAIDRLEKFAKGGEQKPFALFLSIGTPHDPWTRENVPKEYYDKFKDVEFPYPENYAEKNDKHADMWARIGKKDRRALPEWQRVYYAMVNNLDDNLGRLLNAVKRLGFDKNTIFVFTSDHGELFGAHGRRAKNIFYDEAIRVPFLLSYDKIAAGRNDLVINTVDLMPTLLSLMDLPVPSEVEGEDLSKYLLSGITREDGALLMGTGKTALYGNGNEWRGLKTKRYTYAVYKRDGEEHLYDDEADPLQMNNLAKNADYEGVMRALKAEMYEKMKKIGDDFSWNSFYRKNWIKHRKIKEFLPREKDL